MSYPITIRVAVFRTAWRLGCGFRGSLGIAAASDPIDALAAARFVRDGTFVDRVWQRRDALPVPWESETPCFACMGMHADHAPGCSHDPNGVHGRGRHTP